MSLCFFLDSHVRAVVVMDQSWEIGSQAIRFYLIYPLWMLHVLALDRVFLLGGMVRSRSPCYMQPTVLGSWLANFF